MIKKVKNTFPCTYAISALKGKEIAKNKSKRVYKEKR